LIRYPDAGAEINVTGVVGSALIWASVKDMENPITRFAPFSCAEVFVTIGLAI
jgi:hypothetical protein